MWLLAVQKNSDANSSETDRNPILLTGYFVSLRILFCLYKGSISNHKVTCICSQPHEHKLLTATDEGNRLSFANQFCTLNSSHQNSMATIDDNSVIFMLAEMRDSQTPPVSSIIIKSPLRNNSDSEDDIPSSQPASKRPRTQAGTKKASPDDGKLPQPAPKGPNTEAGFSHLRNRIANLESTRAKSRKSNMVLKDHVKKGIRPIGLHASVPAQTAPQTRPLTSPRDLYQS